MTDVLATRAQQRIEERFDFDEGVAVDARAKLFGTLYEVTERQTGDAFCLKLWRKTGTPADAELREIWRYEMRHVERVMAHSSARGVIVDIVEFVEDEEDFGVLMEHAGRPLAVLLRKVDRQHWLRTLSIPTNRARLWQNIRRVVIGLGVVHGQGLVHGRVDEQVIFSDGSREPDFRLAGFEWSLWLDRERRAPDGRADKLPDRSGDAVSFVDDWRSLGQIICRLLGIVVDATGLIIPVSGRELPILAESEVRWLRRVCRPRRHEALEAHTLARACNDIIVEVARMANSSQQGRLTLLLTRMVDLGPAIHAVGDGRIPSDEREDQLDFVRGDPDAGVTLYTPPPTADGAQRPYLVTDRMVYRLRPLTEDGRESWDIAECYQYEPRGPELPIAARYRSQSLDVPIDAATSRRQANELTRSVGRTSLSWDAWSRPAEDNVSNDLVKVRSALHLLEVVGAVVKSLDIFPIEILTRPTADRLQIVLRARPNNERDALAAAVGMNDTAKSLEHLFEDEGRDSGVSWRISASPNLGGARGGDAGVTYVDREDVKGIQGYCFNLEGMLPDAKELYLRPAQDRGTEEQIKRRLRNIEALDTRLDLVDMLASPWGARRKLRNQKEISSRTLERLDDPKREAVKTLWVTAPGFWIVGPPGVGKTTLATAIIEIIFRNDPASRVLICSQGHDALNHLEEKIAEAQTKGFLGRDVLIVRSMAMEGKVSSPRRVDRVADATLLKFERSAIVQDAPDGLSKEVRRLAALCRDGQAKDSEEKGVLASLMIEAANIVVTTLNSADIAQMVARQEPFDWVIVEEAAKATGPELAGALALGNRRLLIGDHHQLPPFDADRLGKIFKDGRLIGELLANAQEAVGPLFGDAVLEELARALGDPAQQQDILEAAQQWVEPFRSVVEEDEKRSLAMPHHPALSATLTKQRRMDPAIAEVVSKTFYQERLETDEERVADALNGVAAIIAGDALTSSPVVVVDFPHVSATKNTAPCERARPKWHNPGEAAAVVNALRHLRRNGAVGRKPTLAILSPYASQVAFLEERLDVAFGKELKHIPREFSTVRSGLGYVGTVDSFQGSEADVVIVSLVRNNPRVGLPALGFLREKRRMNVLLSRAREKLILVGSLAFLKAAVDGVNPDQGKHELDFLTRMIGAIRGLTARERRPGVPLASIIASERLRERG